jgi:hypothetical protein
LRSRVAQLPETIFEKNFVVNLLKLFFREFGILASVPAIELDNRDDEE